MLTEMAIRKAKPAEKSFELTDGRGLALRVHPTGTKSWIYRYRYAGKPRRLTLGVYPDLSAVQARKLHQDAILAVKAGLDPGRTAIAQREAQRRAPTVEMVLSEYYDRELYKKKSGRETLRMLKKDILPAWGHLHLTEITRRDIVLMLDGVGERGPIIRNRVGQAISTMFNFAVERGIIEASPATRLKALDEAPRTRVLTDDEIKRLWAVTDPEADGMTLPLKLILRMCLLTGARCGEVSGMRWDEIDGDTWRLPADRTKNRQVLELPITGMMREVIDEAKLLDPDLVFGMKARSVATLLPIKLRSLGFEPFTAHDLRRTARTRWAELGVGDVVAERLLGHLLQGLLRVYNQHPYTAEKRAALKKWANELRRILKIDTGKHAKVIALR